MRKNEDQKNFEYGHFSRSDKVPESYFTENLKGRRDSTELQSSQWPSGQKH